MNSRPNPVTRVRSQYIALREPFDIKHWLGFLARRAVPGVEYVADGTYSRVIESGDVHGFVHIHPLSGESQALVEFVNVPADSVSACVHKAHAMLDADADPASIVGALERDPVLSASVRRCPGLRLPGAWNPFELAVRAILGQQVTVAAARTLATRLVLRLGQPLAESFSASLTHAFPRPEAIATGDLSNLGLPSKRAEAVRLLATAVIDGRVSFSASSEDLLQALVAVPGIGPWTAQYVAMRALRDRDALPAGDIVLRKRLEPGRTLTPREVEQRAQGWRPWRAYGLMHVWAMASEQQ